LLTGEEDVEDALIVFFSHFEEFFVYNKDSGELGIAKNFFQR